ncbi:vWA domain-containing protein [Haliangium sp.]|uniref:vWA domain-containing protein n=1 Tax=Haliangium sp. TaxID=2663208 RepID=UPI003D0D353A
MQATRRWWLAVLVVMAVSCGGRVGDDPVDAGDGSGDGGPVDPCLGDDRPDTCPRTCASDSACPLGSYCGPSATCVSDCTAAGGECGPGRECNDRGRCQDSGPDTGPDAGPEDCAGLTVAPNPIVPTVLLLIDHSGSMRDPIDGSGTPVRIVAVNDALFATMDSIVPRLQSRVRFGAALYATRTGYCPWLPFVAPDLDNYQTIDAAIGDLFGSTNPGGNTPTGLAVAVVADQLAMRDPAEGPRIIVLATDGEPNTCSNAGDYNAGRALSEQAVAAAYAADIQTYVLSVGSGVSTNHLQRLANLGVGKAADEANTPAPYYQALSTEALVAAFETIIDDVRSCSFDISGDLSNIDRDSGVVTLDDMVLVPGSDWRFETPERIELLGATCERYLDTLTPVLEANFDCDYDVIVN